MQFFSGFFHSAVVEESHHSFVPLKVESCKIQAMRSAPKQASEAIGVRIFTPRGQGQGNSIREYQALFRGKGRCHDRSWGPKEVFTVVVGDDGALALRENAEDSKELRNQGPPAPGELT